MGSGVEDDEKVDVLVEERLNERGDDISYEILNFAVGGYGLLQQVDVVAKRVFDFKPDAIFYVVQPSEVERSYLRLFQPIKKGANIGYEMLEKVIAESGAQPDHGYRQLKERLEPYGEDLVKWAYSYIAQGCAERGITPVMVFLPQTRRPFQPGEIEHLIGLGKEAGFAYTINLNNVYDDVEMESIMLAPWDFHPNAKGQQLIGNKLYNAFVASDLFKDIQGPVRTALLEQPH